MVMSGASGRKKLHCLSGSVRDKTVIVVDDMIDTGGTLRYTSELLRREGANDFYMLSTHGIFSPGAIEAKRDCALRPKKGVAHFTLPARLFED